MELMELMELFCEATDSPAVNEHSNMPRKWREGRVDESVSLFFLLIISS